MSEFHDPMSGRSYTVEGGIGSPVNGTRARVWIKAFNQHGRWLHTRSVRLDVHTARRLVDELKLAIDRAIKYEAEFETVLKEKVTSMNIVWTNPEDVPPPPIPCHWFRIVRTDMTTETTYAQYLGPREVVEESDHETS